MGVWTYLRHYINLRILYSILTEFRTVGDFTLNWETQQYKCWIAQYITFSLLAALQSLNIFWYHFVIKIAWNMAFKHVEKDVRSDDEDDEVEEEDRSIAEKEEERAVLNGKPKELDNAKANGTLAKSTFNGTASKGHDKYAEIKKEK